MNLNFDGKVVLITGGTDGLGATLAGRLTEEGALVAVCGRDPQRLASTRSKLENLAADRGGQALAIEADVTVPEQLAAFVEAAVERWGRIDALVNNAGASATGTIETITDDAWSADLELKLIAAARAVRLVLPHLRAVGGGSILNVLAIGAKTPPAGSMPSAATRAAGMALTKALSKELGPDNIRVNAVLIGLIESGQWRRLAERTGRSLGDVYSGLLAGSNIPLGRLGTGEDFADLASYLLSDRAAFVTGAAINLDGGASPAL